MDTSSLVGFGLTIGFLVVFLVVSWAQLGRARKVLAGEITVGGTPRGSTADQPDDHPGTDDQAGDGASA